MLSHGNHIDAPVAMTTSGEEDAAVAKDNMVEGGGQATPCERCQSLRETVEQHQRDHNFYTSLKKKIALTDSLIKKYNSKCQEFDLEQKKLEEVTFKLASTKRDYKVLEEQLASALKEVIPWRRDKTKFMREMQECRSRLRDAGEKLEGSEASCVQFKEGFQDIQERLESLEEKCSDQKKVAEKAQLAEKKTSSLLAKCKEELTSCRKELKTAKRRETSLASQHQKAKDKMCELIEVLRDHGIPVPRIHKSLLRGPAASREGISTEADTDFDQAVEEEEEDFAAPPEDVPEGRPLSPAETAAGGPEGSPSVAEKEKCLQILDKFSWGLASCVSPLPPTPPPLSPASGVEMMSDGSSDANRDGDSNSESFSDVADQIESQLSLVQEAGRPGGASPNPKEAEEKEEEEEEEKEEEEVTAPRRRQLRQTPQRSTKNRRMSRRTGGDVPPDDSEDDSTEKQRRGRRPRRPVPRSGEAGTPSRRGGSASSDADHRLQDHPGSGANESPSPPGRARTKRGRGQEPRKCGERSGSTAEVSGRDSTDGEKRRERRLSARVLGRTSTLSEDSDDSQRSKKSPENKPGQTQWNGNSLSTADNSQASSKDPGEQLTPVTTEPKKHPEDTLAKQKQLLLSPDRRLTRAQLRTLKEQGAPDPTGICSGSEEVLHSEITKQRTLPERTAPSDGPSSRGGVEEEARSTDPSSSESPLKQDGKERPQRPVTRSLSQSDCESIRETRTPSLPARTSARRLLRSNSATEDASALHDSCKLDPEPFATKTEATSQPPSPSPRKRLRSATLSDSSPGSSAEKDSESKARAKRLPGGITPKVPSKAASEPLLKNARPDSDHSDGPREGQAPATRRVTRSQAQASATEDKRITRGMLKSAAVIAASKTESETLPANESGPSPQLCPGSSKPETSPGVGQDQDVQVAGETRSRSESRESVVSGSARAEAPREVRGSRPDCEPSDVQESSPRGSPPKGLSGGVGADTPGDDAASRRRLEGSFSCTEEKPESPSGGISGSCAVTTPDGVVATGGENAANHHARVAEEQNAGELPTSDPGSSDDRAEVLVSSDDEEPRSEGPSTKSSTISSEDGTTRGHSPEELPSPEEAALKPEPGESKKSEVDSHEAVTLTEQPTEENLNPGLEELPSGEATSPPTTERPDPVARVDEAPVSGHRRDTDEDTAVQPDAHHLPAESASSSESDPSKEDAVCEADPEHQPAGSDGHHQNATPSEGAKVEALAQSVAAPSADCLPSEEPAGPAPRQGAVSASVPTQVLCVEAESTRAGTPTADEVAGLNAVSGHVSPSADPGSGADRPLSPLASPSRSPPVSPLSPSPLVFEPIISLPRMHSPLPPSPGIPDAGVPEEEEEVGQPASTAEDVHRRGEPPPVDQPRMISPLFPTPVPPAISPLPEPPMPSVLSPLSDLSPPRLGRLSALDRSPMISPLRNPLIPSPCNFHAEAPSDALPVRPQHLLPPVRRQSASRCLAASFSSTAAPGMSPNPEIISPRLHSRASEMVFEFGESKPGASGLQMLPRPGRDAPPLSGPGGGGRTGPRRAGPADAREDASAEPVRRGFLKLDRKAPAVDKQESDVERRPEAAKPEEATSPENTASIKKSVDPPQDASSSEPPENLLSERLPVPPKKTRQRKAPSKQEEPKPASSQNGQKKEGETVRAPEEKTRKASSGNDYLEMAVSRRWTRSQVGTSARPPQTSPRRPRGKTETSSRNPAGEEETAGQDLRPPARVARKRRTSADSSDRAPARVDAGSAESKPSDASAVRSPEGERPETGGPQPRLTCSGKTLLIPALELKTKGFKRSGSRRKRPEGTTEAENGTEIVPDGKDSGPSPGKEGSGLAETEADSSLLGRQTTALKDQEGLPSGGEADSQRGAHPNPDDESRCGACSKEDGTEDSRAHPEPAPVTSKDTPADRLDREGSERPTPASDSTVGGGSKEAAPLEAGTPRGDPSSKADDQPAPRAAKASRKIGNIWGSMASRKEPGFAVFNRGLNAKKRKHSQELRDLREATGKRSRESQKAAGPADGGTGISVDQAPRPATQPSADWKAVPASSESVSGPFCFPEQADPIRAANAKSAPSRELVESGPRPDAPRPEIPASRLPGSSSENRDSLGRSSGTQADVSPPSRIGGRPAGASHPALASSDPSGSEADPRRGPEGPAATGPGQGGGRADADESLQSPSAERREAGDPAERDGSPGSRKRRASGECDPETDESPTPSKQPKTSALPPSVELGSQDKPLPRKLVIPALGDLLQRVKAHRSQLNAKPLLAAILSFLGGNAISLMLAIRAKCLAKNTSTRPLLLPHEEELVACIMASRLPEKKSGMGMLLSCLCRAVKNQPLSASHMKRVDVAASYCRVMAAVVRQTGAIDRVRVFCFDLLRDGVANAEELLLNIAVTWPTVLLKKEGAAASPIRSAIEVVTMQRLVLAACPQNLQAQELIQCFGVLCGWAVPEGNEPDRQCERLVASLRDTEVTKLRHCGPPMRTLTPRAYETVKAMELLAWHRGWQWTNNRLIRDQLWPVLKAWSQAVQAAKAAKAAEAAGPVRRRPATTDRCADTPADASACAVMKLIGCVSSIGLDAGKESVFELLKMLAAVLQQPSSSVPRTVQTFTAEAILCLSPSNPPFARDVLQRWRDDGAPAAALPFSVQAKLRVLSKVAGALQGGERGEASSASSVSSRTSGQVLSSVATA